LSTRIDPALVDRWRSARVWVDLPIAGAVEVVPDDVTKPEHFPREIDVIHLVTAWNPGAHPLSVAENGTRHSALLNYLDHQGIDHWDAGGYSADRSWIELGLAVPDVEEALALEIGRHFGQLAIYRWTARDLAVLDCTDGAAIARYGWCARPCPERPEVIAAQ
jgi:hypothetical protein